MICTSPSLYASNAGAARMRTRSKVGAIGDVLTEPASAS